MKVICINAGYKVNGAGAIHKANGLVEGNVYTVIKIIPPIFKERGFVLEEVKSTHFTGAFLESRFAPLSDVDEKDLVNQMEEECIS